MQDLPEINIEPHDGEIICEVCEQKANFLVGSRNELDGKYRCSPCFKEIKPEYSEIVFSIGRILEELSGIKERNITPEEMHELYGDRKD